MQNAKCRMNFCSGAPTAQKKIAQPNGLGKSLGVPLALSELAPMSIDTQSVGLGYLLLRRWRL
jgi:hypothetical protein